MEAFGKKKWVIPGGNIPLKSNGREPEMVSQDKIAVLNTSNETAELNLTIYHHNQEPVKNYKVMVKGQRVKKFRINDLIEPFPVYLGTEYSLVIESNHEVVVQFMKMNTSHSHVSIMGTMGFGTNT